jgi:hypothetical protein
VGGKTVLLFWYRNQIYAIEARSPAEGAYSEGFIKAKFTQDFCIGGRAGTGWRELAGLRHKRGNMIRGPGVKLWSCAAGGGLAWAVASGEPCPTACTPPPRRVPCHRQPVQPEGRRHRELVPQQPRAAHADPVLHMPPTGDLPRPPGRHRHLGGCFRCAAPPLAGAA